MNSSARQGTKAAEGTLGNRGTVLVVDGDRGVREAVVELARRLGHDALAHRPGIGVLQSLPAGPPALALLEVEAVAMSGIALMRELHERYERDVPVILISAERTLAHDRTAGLLLGADDYVAKPFEPEELLARMRRSLRRFEASGHGNGQQKPETPHLTAREREVLGLLSRGRSQREIAAELVVSDKTVGTHIQHLLMKLGVHSRAQAVAEAYGRGLVTPNPIAHTP